MPRPLYRRWQVQQVVYPAQVVSLPPLPHQRRPRFQLHLSTGQTLIARRVVLANGCATPQLPAWVKQIPAGYPSDRLQHSSQIDLRGL